MPISKYSGSSRRNNRGFTLLEIVVVMGIMAILSAMMLGYSQRNSKQVLLATTQVKLASIFSRAKALSIQSFFDSGSGGGDEVICAHGVHIDIDSQEMFIFQDIRDSGSCPRDPRQYDYSATDDRELEGELNKVSLADKSIKIESADSQYVIFIPPEPRVEFDGDNPNTSSVVITDGDMNLTVTVTKDGQIRME